MVPSLAKATVTNAGRASPTVSVNRVYSPMGSKVLGLVLFQMRLRVLAVLGPQSSTCQHWRLRSKRGMTALPSSGRRADPRDAAVLSHQSSMVSLDRKSVV